MESLESFNLSGCQKLEKFPEIRGNMESLSKLLLARNAIREPSSSIGQLSQLAIFPENLGDLNELEEIYAGNTAIWQLPDSIGNLSKLKTLSLRKGWSLDLSGCNLCDSQAAALMNITSLLELDLSRNEFIYFPDVFSRLSHLQYLNIAHCQELKELPQLPQNIEELYVEDFLAKESIAKLRMYTRLNLVSFTNYSFDQQSYTEESIGSSISDEILSLFLSNNMDGVILPSLNSDHRVTCSIVFPERAIPRWFMHQSVEEKISFELPINWYDDKFMGFAICCVTLMRAGVCSPDSGLSEKYVNAFINAKLICNDHLKDLKVLEKECKVSGTDVRDINRYSLFEVSIPGRIVRHWGVHIIYEDGRTFFAKKYRSIGFT
ncbi:hypothetical protein H5410_033070 [Solanum commersonii]|uniref:C-JID domain-containing protein n=1 Tax=Solanum commersonii TaxID=4109 RepID=A0A9J5YRH9_SOLCO|nr:hypothetical protein H5410_033070 [Solanum commersonii]